MWANLGWDSALLYAHPSPAPTSLDSLTIHPVSNPEPSVYYHPAPSLLPFDLTSVHFWTLKVTNLL